MRKSHKEMIQNFEKALRVMWGVLSKGCICIEFVKKVVLSIMKQLPQKYHG